MDIKNLFGKRSRTVASRAASLIEKIVRRQISFHKNNYENYFILGELYAKFTQHQNFTNAYWMKIEEGENRNVVKEL